MEPVDYTKLTWQEKREARLKYVEFQNGLCWFCKSSLAETSPYEKVEIEIKTELFPPNFFKYPVHLHHSHETGMTEGAVHNYCNAFMWQYMHE